VAIAVRVWVNATNQLKEAARDSDNMMELVCGAHIHPGGVTCVEGSQRLLDAAS